MCRSQKSGFCGGQALRIFHILLVQRLPNNQPFILKLADRRMEYHSSDDDADTVSWLFSIDDRLRHAVRDVQEDVKPSWVELINDTDNRIGCGRPALGLGICLATNDRARSSLYYLRVYFAPSDH